MIDNKSFYASVESMTRGINPLKSVLVVMSETANTGSGLVLAASPQAKKNYLVLVMFRANMKCQKMNELLLRHQE